MRILFISSNRIGDAVLSTGLLSYLNQAYPHARFTIAAGPAAAPLFGGIPNLERIILLRKRKHSLHWLALWRKTVLKRWDIVIDLRRSALSYALFAKRRLIQPKKQPGQHSLLSLAATLGLQDTPPAPHIWTNKPHEDLATKLIPADKTVLAVGPTANWQGKIWPADYFTKLIEKLTAPDGPLPHAHVAVFGAPDERLQANPVLRAIPKDRRIDLVGKLDLLSAAACLRKARFYVGNDSGLMHMAAAVGTPTLGLFGPSLTEHYAPWGDNTSYVRTPESFDELVGHPDYDRHTTGSLMTSLTVETVLEASKTLLTRKTEETA